MIPSPVPSPRGTARFRSLLKPTALAVALSFAAACAPSDPLLEVRKQQAAGNHAATIEPLRELLRTQKDDPETNLLYGVALVQTGKRGLAEWSLRKAMEDPEYRLAAGRLLAFGEMVAQNHDAAIATLTELIDEYPDDVELLIMRANSRAHSRMKLEDALADVDRVFALDPENIDVYEPQILSLLGLERAEEAGVAIEALGKRIDESASDADLAGWHCATAALFAFESEEQELAAERFADCTERFPGHSNVVNNALNYYDGERNRERSMEVLERAVEAAPGSREFRTHYATRLRVVGRAEEATELLKTGTDSQDLRAAATAWYDLAKHYQSLDQSESAVDAYERSLALVKESGIELAQMKLEFGDALLLAGEYDRALEVAESLSIPAYREVLRARVAQERGEPEQALAHFDEVFRLWPDNPWARYYGALAAEAIGDFDRAIESYRYSIRIAAGATDARQRLARLHLSEGKPQEAIHILRLKAEHEMLDIDGEMLTLEIWGAIGNRKSIQAHLGRIAKASARLHGRGLAAAATGIGERIGAGAAVKLIRETEDVDLTSLDYADALRELVRFSARAGTGAAPELETALAAHPEAAVLHEIRGLEAELAGDTTGAASAYARARELDAEDVRALGGLCRVAPREEPEAVVAACTRAIEADPEDRDAAIVGAEVLRALGRTPEAVETLERALAYRPYDAGLASRLALALSDGGGQAERVESLQSRAARFSPSVASNGPGEARAPSGRG